MKALSIITGLLSLAYLANVIVGKLSLVLSQRFTPIGIGDKTSALLLFVISILFTIVVLRKEHDTLGGDNDS